MTGVDFYDTSETAERWLHCATSSLPLGLRGSMTDDIDNRLRQLCDIAKVEYGRDEIKALAQEIARLLVEKLKRQPPDRKAG
jgi:hypothetical protein